MKNLNVTAENFSTIREALKSGQVVKVNNTLVLSTFEPNTETLNENTGKYTRTPFMYVAKDGKKFTSTTLKKALGIEPEQKGERKNVTFSSIWPQLKALAKDASLEELQEASKFLSSLYEEKKKAQESAKAKEIEELERKLRELKGY